MRLVAIGCVWLLTMGCAPKTGSPAAEASAAAAYVPMDLEALFAATEEDDEDEFSSELVFFFDTADCGDLVGLEVNAMMGSLTQSDIMCLTNAYEDEDLLTGKEKVSLLLMNDARAKGNIDRWAVYANKHLNSIGPADPNICYLYAKYQYNTHNSFEAITYAKRAMENKAVWAGGKEFVSRVNNLHKIIALSQYRIWEGLNKEYLVDHDDKLRGDVDKARNSAKTAAMDWLEYARGANRDSTAALELCKTAAGNDEACESR